MSHHEPNDGHAHVFAAVCLACGSTDKELGLVYTLNRLPCMTPVRSGMGAEDYCAKCQLPLSMHKQQPVDNPGPASSENDDYPTRQATS